MTTEPTIPTDSTSGRLPTSALLAGAGGLLIILGAFLPWITIGGLFSLSGIDTQYGIATLIAGIVILVAAFGAGKVYGANKSKAAATVIAVLGGISLAAGLYAGFAIRDRLAEDNTDQEASESVSTGDEELDATFDDFANDLAEAFQPSTGVGVYATALGGALALVGGVMAVRRKV